MHAFLQHATKPSTKKNRKLPQRPPIKPKQKAIKPTQKAIKPTEKGAEAGFGTRGFLKMAPKLSQGLGFRV